MWLFSGSIPIIRNSRRLKIDVWDSYSYAVKMKFFCSRLEMERKGYTYAYVGPMFVHHVVTDEDFASAKPPPSKKPREDVNREHRKTSSKSSSQDSNSQSTEKSR